MGRRGMLRRLVDRLARALPSAFVEFGLRAAALAPPSMKTPLFERICTKLVFASLKDTNRAVRTNMGISSKLRCTLPFAKALYAFGRPENMPIDRASLALVFELSRDCRHFVDVGANDGLFTFLVDEVEPSRRPEIHWFEPDSAIHARLANNLMANDVPARANKAAVSDRKGVATFHRNFANDGCGSLTDCYVEQHVTGRDLVETVTLSDYFRDCGIRDALVKIDVEGAGYEAWAGASGVADDIKYLVIEMLAQEIDRGLPEKIVSETGFHAYYIKDFELEEIRGGNYRFVDPYWNWLFCRLDPAGLSERLAGTKFRVLGKDARV